MPVGKIGGDLSIHNYQEDMLCKMIMRLRIGNSVYNPHGKKRSEHLWDPGNKRMWLL